MMSENSQDLQIFDESKVLFAKCPLCQKKSTKFHCNECLKAKTVSFEDEPEKTWKQLLENKTKIERYIKTLSAKYEKEGDWRYKSVEDEIVVARQKNEALKQLVQTKRKKLEKSKVQVQKHKMYMANKKPEIANFRTNLEIFKKNLGDLQQRIHVREKECVDIRRKIKEKAHKLLSEIIQTVFQLGIVGTSRDNELLNSRNLVENSSVSQNDMMNSSFIRSHYKIVEAQLPLDGEYESFVIADGATSDVQERNLNNILSGLGHLTQLVQIMACCCCVYLPHKLDFTEFKYDDTDETTRNTRKFLNSIEFKHLVWKLNANVFYLCVSQKCPPDILVFSNAMHNLTAFLNYRNSDIANQDALDYSMVHARQLPSPEGFVEDDNYLDVCLKEWEELNPTEEGVPSSLPFTHPSLLKDDYF